MNIRINSLLLIASIFAAFSCSKNEDVPVLPEGGEEITFSNVATKAVNGIEDIEQIGVWAAMTKDGETSDYISILDNERVYPTDEAHTNWVYDNTRYWFENYHFYFIASYPYNQNGSGIGSFQKFEVVQNNITRIGYSLDVDTYNEGTSTHTGVDLLAAATYVNTSSEWSRTVTLNMRHLLTKVNLKISQDTREEVGDPNNDYYITKVALSGISTNGEYLVITDENQIAQEWSLESANNYSFDKTYDGSQTLRSQNEISVWEDNGEGGLLLIPQSIPIDKVKIRVEYLYQLAQSTEKKPGFVEAYLPASDDLWQSGKRITYRLAIAKPTNIRFLAPTVESWGAPQTGGTIIIK